MPVYFNLKYIYKINTEYINYINRSKLSIEFNKDKYMNDIQKEVYHYLPDNNEI